MALPPGLYERLITRALRDALEGEASLDRETSELTKDAAPHVLAKHIHDAVLRVLRERGKLEGQLEVANRVLTVLAETTDETVDARDAVEEPARLLLALVREEEKRLGTGTLPRPSLPLRQSDLLVNGPRDLRVGREIKLELASADRVDVLMSFLKWSGLRVVRDELAAFCRRRPGGLRVLTTTYMHATEAEALEALAALGAEVRVSYDDRRTRLHAKAWLFGRDSGFGTAVIGSSNLSHSAMLEGCEWNVRVSGVDNPTILAKFETTFAQYWEDPAFEVYERARFMEVVGQRSDPHRDRLARLVRFTALPHQAAALEALEVERANGYRRNLLVAATGTGKTVVAALDYARLRKEHGEASLLFVAHRREILEQSLAVFRGALSEGSFGELLVGDERPIVGKHVFATIQSLSEARLAQLAPDAYDVVVIDEAHHAPARSYQALLDHLRPHTLLGLTATPERADGRSLLPDFDGRIASQLRLWDAIDLGLLSPFQYFGIHDGVDISRCFDPRRGRYDVTALDRVYSGDDERAKLVVRELHRRVRDPKRMRALGFCVTIAHATFMAEYFSRQGIPSLELSGETNTPERRLAVEQLARGEVACVFTVDLFNEGVDIPEVDTVLFLRPSESATVFLQQLGRGLRLHGEKDCLTVLDFIGGAHRAFRFDLRYRALTGGSRAEVRDAVERSFPFLPSGCSIELEPSAQKIVLDNIRHALDAGWTTLADELRVNGDMDLGTFLARVDLPATDLYANTRRSFTDLRARAGLAAEPTGELYRGLARLLHIDDPLRLDTFARWLAADRAPAPEDHARLQLMFFGALGQGQRPVEQLQDMWSEVWSDAALRRELREILDVLADGRRRPTWALDDLPLAVHATYARDEIAAALGQTRKGKLLRTQTGVYWDEASRSDILYVTLDKDAKDFTPTTLYNDYLISPTHFHWESQGNTRADSETGRRYREHVARGSRVLLFVRKSKKAQRGGVTPPYLFLGPVRYESHRSERPMQIVWRLERAAPAEWVQEVKIAAG
ncbi:MAG: DUF3427 domain-containing protein [Sandaracinaceae bacterium]